jgi:ribosome biogenesis GTPase
MAKKKQKLRAEFRKKHDLRAKKRDLTRQFTAADGPELDEALSERISGKGDLTRRRTVIGQSAEEGADALAVRLEVEEGRQGRVLSIHGLASQVQDAEGRIYRCATRGLLKNLSTDQRHVVAVGDLVVFRPVGKEEGVIERIEPRHGVLSRGSKGRRQVIVANIDLLLIVTSAAEPTIKPNLIDRFLVAAEQMRIEPVICINKVDLVDPADLQPLAGVYGRMGYQVLLLSASQGSGVSRLAGLMAGRQSVVAGQSGVGKSSLLNAIDPALNLKVRSVSAETEKGRHTTTTARLLPLSVGGHVVDTPGIRQFQLWDVIPEEVANYFRDLRPYVGLCRFPDCTHTHEFDCRVKDAVGFGQLDVRRYESYCQLVLPEESLTSDDEE